MTNTKPVTTPEKSGIKILVSLGFLGSSDSYDEKRAKAEAHRRALGITAEQDVVAEVAILRHEYRNGVSIVRMPFEGMVQPVIDWFTIEASEAGPESGVWPICVLFPSGDVTFVCFDEEGRLFVEKWLARQFEGWIRQNCPKWMAHICALKVVS